MFACRLKLHRNSTMAVAVVAASLLAPRIATAGNEVVVTTSGAPLKVVVRRDTAAYEKPDTKSTSNPVTTFDFFYVLPPEKGAELKVEPEKPDAALKDGFFRVSTSDKDKDEFGWIAKDDVVVWPHRQAIQMRPIAGRKRAEFFKTDKDLKSTYTGAASRTLEPRADVRSRHLAHAFAGRVQDQESVR